MAPRVAILALIAGSLAIPAAADVRVQVAGSTVDLAATAAPLSEVLDRLSRQTGMKVVYEGPAPRQLVTLAIHGRTPAETVLAVLEGQGINFALDTDPSGTDVRTLLVTGTVSSSGSGTPVRAAPAPPRRAPFAPPPGAGPDAEPPFDEGEEAQPEEPNSLGVPPGVEGVEQPPAPGNTPGAAGQTAPPVNQGPVIPPQQFPVSPFAPRPAAPVAPPVAAPNQPQPGTAPGQSPQQ
jgi:hypothetical protein